VHIKPPAAVSTSPHFPCVRRARTCGFLLRSHFPIARGLRLTTAGMRQFVLSMSAYLSHFARVFTISFSSFSFTDKRHDFMERRPGSCLPVCRTLHYSGRRCGALGKVLSCVLPHIAAKEQDCPAAAFYVTQRAAPLKLVPFALSFALANQETRWELLCPE
jgi:hypothetical protein